MSSRARSADKRTAMPASEESRLRLSWLLERSDGLTRQQERIAIYLLARDEPEARAAIRRMVGQPLMWIGDRESGFWGEIDSWLDRPALERCLAYLEASHDPNALAFYEPQPADVPRIVEALLREEDRRGDEPILFPAYLCAAVWTLRYASAAEARSLAGGIPLRRWQERLELARATGNLMDDLADDLAGAPAVDGLRPDWVPEDHPALVRDLLSGALTRAIVSRDQLSVLRCERMERFPGRWILWGNLDQLAETSAELGHLAGDVAIAGAVDVLQSIVGDRVIRFGGDDFLIPWEGDDGPEVADRLRAAVEAASFAPVGHLDEPVRMTISFGVARAGRVQMSLRRADGALYSAKSSGRNRVVVSEEE